MSLKKEYLVISIMCAFLSFFLVKTFGNQVYSYDIGESTSVKKIQELMNQLEKLENSKEELLERLQKLEAKISDHEAVIAENIYKGEKIQKQLFEARVLAGLTDIQGPGVEIILNDRKKDNIMPGEMYSITDFIVHDSDLLEVINELKAAGAEAIGINGVRILGNSRISCGGPTINVGDDQRFAPPFVIHAIGDPDALAGYFQRADSIYHILTFYGLEFSIKKLDNVRIPRYYGEVDFKYAKPVKED